jgi:hypothetical protein
MENASEGYLAANRNFAQASRDIEAVQTGRDAAMRGRAEDTVPSFNGLTAQRQQTFRAGYVDSLIADAQKAASGANEARPLLNDAFRDEAAVIAPGNDLMQRRLGREQTIFETRPASPHQVSAVAQTRPTLQEEATALVNDGATLEE